MIYGSVLGFNSRGDICFCVRKNGRVIEAITYTYDTLFATSEAPLCVGVSLFLRDLLVA